MAAIVLVIVEEDGPLRVFSAMWAVLIPTARYYYVYHTRICGTCARKERYQKATMIHTWQSQFRKVERSEEKLVITLCDQDKLL